MCNLVRRAPLKSGEKVAKNPVEKIASNPVTSVAVMVFSALNRGAHFAEGKKCAHFAEEKKYLLELPEVFQTAPALYRPRQPLERQTSLEKSEETSQNFPPLPHPKIVKNCPLNFLQDGGFQSYSVI